MVLTQSSLLQSSTFSSTFGSHLVDLVADNVAHLLLLLVDLDLHLSPQLLLLKSIQVADYLESGLKNYCGHETSEAADHVDDTSANEVNEAQVLKPSFSPYPRSTYRVYDGRDVERVDDMGAQVSPLRHRRVLDLHTDEAKTEGDNPPGVVDGLKILTISFSIADNTTSCLG